ncbi:MAG: hypothetical protein F4X66_19360 [Chloroflexi bacterium]|nr:hypothetical protein [Chloroflexota bacterium]MYE40723.1 hypothetical protein [Chloroflexota bacterium]
MAAGSKVGVLLNRLRRTVSPLCLALLVISVGCAELTGTGNQPEGQPRKEATRPAQQTEESMTPVERATSTAEARDRALPLIVGQTGGECDFGYTSVAFATGLRDRLHPGDSLTFTAQILLFNADLNLERTLACSADTGELPVEYTLQIRTETELGHWAAVKPYTPITAPRDSTPVPD